MMAASTPDVPLQSRVLDDKSPLCIPFILDRLSAHRAASDSASPGTGPQRPFVIGLNGVQGVGKTTLVRALAQTLQQREHLDTLVLSIDDFYLRHHDQLALAAAHPSNALVQYRGEPSTHDLPLLTSVLDLVLAGQPAHVPQYDKAAFAGLGDRAPESQWPPVNQPPGPGEGDQQQQRPVQVVLLEGWCVGFRARPDDEVEAAWRQPHSRTLHRHKLEHLLFVNHALRAYGPVWDLLDAFVHVDAEETEYVYEWRRQQEADLRRDRGTGMSDEQVVRFVDAYYPAYELFGDGVREGVFKDSKDAPAGRQLRIVVGKDRRVTDHYVI